MGTQNTQATVTTMLIGFPPETKMCPRFRKYKSCSSVVLLVALVFNATLTAKVISWRSVTHMCFLAFSHQYLHNFSFQSHRLLFSHASTEVRGENSPERNFASTGDRTHNHQVMSPTGSPLSYQGGAQSCSVKGGLIHLRKVATFCCL